MKRLRIAGVGILLRRSMLGASPAMFFKGMSVERCEALGSVAYNKLFSEPVIFERNAVARGDVDAGCSRSARGVSPTHLPLPRIG